MDEEDDPENLHFTVAQAYDMISEFGSATSSPRWRQIWRMKGPLSGNLLIWQLRHECILTSEVLFRRNVAPTPRCFRCEQMCETNLHAIRDCEYSHKIWKRIVKNKNWGTFFGIKDAKEWVDWNLSPKVADDQMENDWDLHFREATKRIWFWRNHTLHNPNRRPPPPNMVVEEINRRMQAIRAAMATEERSREMNDHG